MKHAKIRYQGTEYSVTVGDDEAIKLPNGNVIAGDSADVEWLPPAQGTLFAMPTTPLN